MKREQILLVGFGILAVGFAAYWEAVVNQKPRHKGAEITPETIQIGLKNPPLWIFYNDSDVNSRFWSDFGARSSHVINVPIMNLFYQSIVKANGKQYRVEVIGGLQGVATLLGKDSMPKPLQNLRASVGTAQEDWIRTAVLAKYGGLWLSPSVVALKGFGHLPDDKIVAFGQDDVSTYSSPVPGFRALWVPDQGHPMMVEWEKRIRDRLENQLGGLQIRGDAKSDWVELCHGKEGVEIRRDCEFSRNMRTQKKLQLEDLFATVSGTDLPFEIPSCAKYIVVPYEDLQRRTMFSWILRNSEKQILESDMAISKILRDRVDIN